MAALPSPCPLAPQVTLMLQKQASVPRHLDQARDVIKKLPLFDGLSDGEKDEFLSKTHVKNYLRGAYLFTQGDNVRSFYIVQSGVVQLFRTTPGGDEITTDILIEGDTICEGKVFRYNTFHPDYALCVEDSTLLEFSAHWLRESVRKNTTLSLNMLSILSLRSQL